MNDDLNLDELEQRLKDPGFWNRRQTGLSDTEVGELIALARKGQREDATIRELQVQLDDKIDSFARAERYERALRAICQTATAGQTEPLRKIAREALKEKP